MDEKIRLLQNGGCISKSLSLRAATVIIVPKMSDSLNPQKQPLCLVLDYRSLIKSINASHNGKSVISYYLLPNINLLARLQKCTIFFSFDLRSGYHHIDLMTEAMPKTPLPQQVVNGTGSWPNSLYAHYPVYSAITCCGYCLD